MPSKRRKHKDFTTEDWYNHATQRKLENKARYLVYQAVKLGLLPSAISQKCVLCQHPAHVYHHPNGYTGSDALNVVALCAAHHSYVHSERGSSTIDKLGNVTK